MKRNTSPFKWRHYEPEIILLCVRWYCHYQLSYRDLQAIIEIARQAKNRPRYAPGYLAPPPTIINSSSRVV